MTSPTWETTRSSLLQREPAFYELEPGGALTLQLGDEDWLLEITPDGQLICQVGYELEDMKSILSEGTPEDLGTDELAKQARFYVQQTVSKQRDQFKAAGFQESSEMNEEYVAVMFQRAIDLQNMDEVEQAVRWCQRQFA